MPTHPEHRAALRVGIPRVLSMWTAHQFWTGFLTALGIEPRNIVFSSETSEERFRRFGMGRVTVDTCYPVKCVSAHYGELLFGQRRKIDVLLHPMHYSMPSFLRGLVMDTLTCPRDMAAAESVRAGFQRERDLFREHGVVYVAPLVWLGEPPAVVARQLFEGLRDVLWLEKDETRSAVYAGFRALATFDAAMRAASRRVLEACARDNAPCMLVLGRPYHMDPGIGHEVAAPLQLAGVPILWAHHLPIDADILEWLFGDELRRGEIRDPLDISDVWNSSFSNSTNEIVWSAKFAARMPWITCVLRLSSYECGMDQPSYTPAQRIVEAGGTLYFRFGDLDATRPAGSVRVRTETILHYFNRYSARIIRRKLAVLQSARPWPASWADRAHIDASGRRA